MQVTEITGGVEGNRTPDLVIANVTDIAATRAKPCFSFTEITHFRPKLHKTAQSTQPKLCHVNGDFCAYSVEFEPIASGVAV